MAVEINDEASMSIKNSFLMGVVGVSLLGGLLGGCASDQPKTHAQQVNTEIENLRLEQQEQQEEKTDGGLIAPAMFDPHPSDVGP